MTLRMLNLKFSQESLVPERIMKFTKKLQRIKLEISALNKDTYKHRRKWSVPIENVSMRDKDMKTSKISLK